MVDILRDVRSELIGIKSKLSGGTPAKENALPRTISSATHGYGTLWDNEAHMV